MGVGRVAQDLILLAEQFKIQVPFGVGGEENQQTERHSQ
jgi:hypothetical protein